MTEYALENGIVEVDVPVEVGQGSGHFWFPSLHRVGGAEEMLICAAIRSDDVAQGEWPADLYVSLDGGATWRFDQSIESYGHASVRHNATATLMMPYELWPVLPQDCRSGTAQGTLFEATAGGGLEVVRRDVWFLDFPAPFARSREVEIALNHTGHIRPLASGSMLTNVYGKLEGNDYLRTFAVVSEDSGFTWNYQGTVADETALPDAEEGPNEADTVQLSNGDLLCIYRVAWNRDFHKSYSQDEGLTWSEPMHMEGMWAVQPRLCQLASGALILTGGRPGLFLWLCVDGRGEKWERVNLGAHHNASIEGQDRRFSDAYVNADKKWEDPARSTSYTAVMPRGSDGLTVTYDRLANGWSGAPGPNGEVDRIFSVAVKVSI